MSCIELSCKTCGHEWASLTDKECPECGGRNLARFFDEDNEPTPDYGDFGEDQLD